MGKKSSRQTDARAAALEKARAEQRQRERRVRFTIWGVVAVAVVGLGVAVAIVIGNAAKEQAAIDEAAAAPIEGVEVVEDQGAAHVPALPEPTAIEAGTLLPPTGGDHDPVWLNCGVYSAPVPTFNAVHSLEHGAVWVTYSPGLDESQVATLREAVTPYSYSILSPFDGLAAPIVLTAWGVQLEVDDADDERIDVFLAKYVQGEQTPEPGAACTGGVGEPA